MKNHFVLLALFFGMAMCTAQSDVVVLNDSETHKNLKGIIASMAKSATPADLSLSEIAQVNALMEESIRNYNRALKEGTKRKQSKLYRIMALKKYKLQMVPYLNEKGEKEIWINGFCDDMGANWRKEIVFVFDGGNCFFSLRLNLEKQECIAIGVNGYS